jgi:hypothetical protein
MVTLAKAQVVGKAPTNTLYSAFVGGFSLLVGGIGLAGLWLEALPPFIPLALDAIAGVLALCGGIVRLPCPPHSCRIPGHSVDPSLSS